MSAPWHAREGPPWGTGAPPWGTGAPPWGTGTPPWGTGAPPWITESASGAPSASSLFRTAGSSATVAPAGSAHATTPGLSSTASPSSSASSTAPAFTPTQTASAASSALPPHTASRASSHGAAIGGGIAGACILAVLALLLFCLRRRRARPADIEVFTEKLPSTAHTVAALPPKRQGALTHTAAAPTETTTAASPRSAASSDATHGLLVRDTKLARAPPVEAAPTATASTDSHVLEEVHRLRAEVGLLRAREAERAWGDDELPAYDAGAPPPAR